MTRCRAESVVASYLICEYALIAIFETVDVFLVATNDSSIATEDEDEGEGDGDESAASDTGRHLIRLLHVSALANGMGLSLI